MRRGYLYSHAKELGCNKIALGHHFDDVIETMLMGMLYSGIMDIWTVLDLTGVWSWKRYLMALSTAVPYIIAYMSSNVVFLMIGLKPLGEKLNRVQTKHGIF